MNDREKWRESVRDIHAGGMMMMMMIIVDKTNSYFLLDSSVPKICHSTRLGESSHLPLFEIRVKKKASYQIESELNLVRRKKLKTKIFVCAEPESKLY